MGLDVQGNVDNILRTIQTSPDFLEFGRKKIEPILKALISIGFSNVRFYDIAENVPMKDMVLLLSTSYGMENPEEYIGYKIAYKDSTQGKADNQFFPSIDCGENNDKTDEELEWILDLGLEDKCWCDIPLRVDKYLLGLIACAWEGSKDDLTKDDIAVLRLIGSQLATSLLPDSDKLEASRNEISRIIEDSDNSIDLIKSGCDKICQLVGSSIGAVFEYHWPSGKLIKIHEYIHPSLKNKAGDFPECYSYGQFLTGNAWVEKKMRHIVDFDSLDHSHRTLVENNSYDRHNALLEKLSSVLYGKIGNSEKQYMIRLMNHSKNPRLHLVTRHKRIFDILCADLSQGMDNVVSVRRFRDIQSIARSVVLNVSFSKDIWKEILNSLINEGVENCCILAHSEGSAYFTYKYNYGPVFTEDWDKLIKESWNEDELYIKLLKSSGPSIFTVKSLTKDYGLGDVHKKVRNLTY